MTRKIIIIVTILLFLSSSIYKSDVRAVSPTSQTTTSAELDKIQKIKQLVASKVAELKLVEKRGVLGFTKEVSNTQLTIEDLGKQTQNIDIDELTKFQASSSTIKSFGISDIAQGDLIHAIGLYNKDTKRLLARFVIHKKSLPLQQLAGMVLDKNAKKFTIIVEDINGNKKTVDIEKNTKIQSFSKDSGLSKSTFTKITLNERILVTGAPDTKDETIFDAHRIIHFVDIPASSQTKQTSPTPTTSQIKTPTPTTKKLLPTPSKKPSPTPTP